MNPTILKFIIGFFAILFLFSIFSNRPGKTRTRVERETVTIMPDQQLVDATAAEDFDLRVLESLLKETADPAELEKRLNASSPRVHNLDLDENDEIDYIKVTEFGENNQKGLSLTTELAPENGEKQEQEIATILLSKDSDSEGTMEVHGNENLYGSNHYYRSGFSFTDGLLLAMLFSNRQPYFSPYGYGNYPNTYGRGRPSSTRDYKRGISGRTSGSKMTASSSSKMAGAPRSPNAGKVAKNVKAPLKNPTATQKSFQTRNPSKRVKSGGFGRSGSSRVASSGSSSRTSTTKRSTASKVFGSRPSRPSVRSSTFGRSRSFSSRGGK